MEVKSVPIQTLQRLPVYLSYLKSLQNDCTVNISATNIANALEMNDVQVRKDLAMISGGGRPKTGHNRESLVYDIESFLGYYDLNTAVIAGAGHLGRALLSYDGFSKYGLEIIAAFDIDEKMIGSYVNGKKILNADKMINLCKRMKVRIGIVTVPENQAQRVCDDLIEGGVLAIWNFAPVHLNAPERILVKNENMASSLAVLSKHLKGKL